MIWLIRRLGATKYINQRDKDFLHSYLQEDDYRREFTDALRDFVDMNQFKYAIFTDMIYQSIFKENAKEYREVLNLKRVIERGILFIRKY